MFRALADSAVGGFTIFVVSYLARMRNSGEHDHSISYSCKGPGTFLRDAEPSLLDHGEKYINPGDELDERIEALRRRFELLLGNTAESDPNPKQVPVKGASAPGSILSAP